MAKRVGIGINDAIYVIKKNQPYCYARGGAIQSFLEDFQGLDVRHQKAQLQAILKTAHVYRDDRIELEFRG